MLKKLLAIFFILSFIVIIPNNAYGNPSVESPNGVYMLKGNFMPVNYYGQAQQIFKIPYTIVNGTVEDVTVDQQSFSILVKIKSDSIDDGFFIITIPRNLLDVSPLDDNTFNVFIDGLQVIYSDISMNACSKTISIPFHHNTSKIEIIGNGKGRSFAGSKVLPAYFVTKMNNSTGKEIISINGCIALNMDENNVKIEILNPKGTIYKETSIVPNINGTFSSSFILDDPKINDNYTTKIIYGNYVTMNTFSIPEFPLAIPILVISIVSTILFYRIKPE